MEQTGYQTRPVSLLLVKTFELTHKTKRCAGSRFVQHKTKQLCTLLLKFVELYSQLVISTMLKLSQIS